MSRAVVLAAGLQHAGEPVADERVQLQPSLDSSCSCESSSRCPSHSCTGGAAMGVTEWTGQSTVDLHHTNLMPLGYDSVQILVVVVTVV